MQIEIAKANRKCQCGCTIEKGSKCVVEWEENLFGRKKFNMCSSCAINDATQRLKAASDWIAYLKKIWQKG